MAAQADVAVVGAGIVGCLVAGEVIARQPGARVLVLDRDMIGSGASRRSAGLHAPRGATARLRQMAAYSEAYYARMRRADPRIPISDLPMSVIAAAGSEARLREVYLESAQLRAAEGVPGGEVTVPAGAEAWSGAGCQRADVCRLAQAVAAGLAPRAEFREGVSVAGVDSGGAGASLRLGTGETVRARRVVLAPGPWLGAAAWHRLVAPLRARVKKVVALHIDRAARAAGRVIIFHDEDAFLLPLPGGRWLYSYTCPEWDADPDAVPDGVSGGNLDEARQILRRYSGALADRCVSGRVFCDAYSDSREPQVQALDSDARVIFAGAASGSGYRLAPAIAAEAADLLGLPRRES